MSKDYTGSSAPPINHHDAPEPSNRERLIFWSLWLGIPLLVMIINR